MAWNTPQTAVVGGILTAGFWNLDVRDNFRALGITNIQLGEVIEGVSPGVVRLVDSAGLSIVPGSIAHYPGTTAPANYLLANGQLVSRTTYARLFSVIGTRYGSGAAALYGIRSAGQLYEIHLNDIR